MICFRKSQRNKKQNLFMLTDYNKLLTAYNKVVKSINSCVTTSHLLSSLNMINLFCSNYNHGEDFYTELLSIYHRKSNQIINL